MFGSSGGVFGNTVRPNPDFPGRFLRPAGAPSLRDALNPAVKKYLSPGIDGRLAQAERVGNLLERDAFVRHQDYSAPQRRHGVLGQAVNHSFKFHLLRRTEIESEFISRHTSSFSVKHTARQTFEASESTPSNRQKCISRTIAWAIVPGE